MEHPQVHCLHLGQRHVRPTDRGAGDDVADLHAAERAAEQALRSVPAEDHRATVDGERDRVQSRAGTRLAGSERSTLTVTVRALVSTPVTVPTQANSWRCRGGVLATIETAERLTIVLTCRRSARRGTRRQSGCSGPDRSGRRSDSLTTNFVFVSVLTVTWVVAGGVGLSDAVRIGPMGITTGQWLPADTGSTYAFATNSFLAVLTETTVPETVTHGPFGAVPPLAASAVAGAHASGSAASKLIKARLMQIPSWSPRAASGGAGLRELAAAFLDTARAVHPQSTGHPDVCTSSRRGEGAGKRPRPAPAPLG